MRGFITPLIGVFGGIPDFSAWYVTVNNSRFLIGEFINALISFVIVAAIVYFFVVLPMTKFLERFVSYPWAHLDIAGTAWDAKDIPYASKGATGYGVRLFVDWLRRA